MRAITMYAVTILLIGTMVFGQVQPTAAQVAVPPPKLGLGLESIGSACCISIRPGMEGPKCSNEGLLGDIRSIGKGS